MSDVLNVSLRDDLGTRASQRLRQQGHVPAVLYGHGMANVNLAISAVELETAIRRNAKLVDIRGAVDDSALIKDVQWDAFGNDVLHIDLTRVSAEESVDVVISIELVGEAPGTKEGGILEHALHEVQIRCPAGKLPDKFTVKVNELRLGHSITVAELTLPEGAELLGAPDATIVSCAEPLAQPADDEEVAPLDGTEPEVIGRKEEEEGEGEN